MPIMLRRDLRQPDEKTIKDALLRGLNLQEIGYQEPFMDEVLPNGKFDIPGDADLDEYDLGDEDMPLD